ncbi:MAG: hypothetical protein WAT19_11600 [Ferruginibacter sp.]
MQKFNFKEYQILHKNDTIHFYVYPANNLTRKKKAIFFLNGSTPDPLFTYERKNNTTNSYFWGHQDFRLLDSEYLYVVIAKKGLHGVINEKKTLWYSPTSFISSKKFVSLLGVASR